MRRDAHRLGDRVARAGASLLQMLSRSLEEPDPLLCIQPLGESSEPKLTRHVLALR
jgi:hypothetical protein